MNSQDSSSQHFHWHYAELDDSNFKMHGHTLLLLVLVLFSIILFLFLFFLYTRWVCHYRHHHSHSTTPTTAPDLPTESPTRTLGLDRVIIDNLPILLYRSPVEEEVQCCICLSNFQDQEKVKILPGCTHTYHPDCVDKWLVTHSNCPLCRASLQVDSAV